MAGTTLTPAQRTLRARIGAFALHAAGGTNTRAGTAAFLEKFVRDVKEAAAARGETLTPAEVERRAVLARRQHFARLALASSRARSKKKAASPVANRDAAEEMTDAAGQSPRAA
jgi:hypothetical protein